MQLEFAIYLKWEFQLKFLTEHISRLYSHSRPLNDAIVHYFLLIKIKKDEKKIPKISLKNLLIFFLNSSIYIKEKQT